MKSYTRALPKRVQKPSRPFSDGHQADYVLLALLGIIILVGLVMLSSASSVVAFETFGDTNYYLKHQFLYGILLGGIALFVFSKIDYRVWKRYSFLLLVVTIFLLIIVLIPGIGYEYLGARRWINIGGVLFQPTEVAKLTFLIYLATWLEKREKHVENFAYGFLAFIFLLGIVSILILLEPNMSTMIIIAVISLVVYFVGGAHVKHLSILGVGGIGLFILLAKIAPYRAARFKVFLNPELDPLGIGYHINQALLAIGSGGIFGQGLGHSRQKYNYLPEVTSDSIFAIIAEELGFIIAIGIIALFIALMIRGFKISRQASDMFGKLVAAGITAWITFQAFVNIGSMLSLLPLTGIPLPFISYGSSSVLTLMAAFGILLNISKHTKS